MTLDDDARAELGRLEAAHRRRGMRVVDGAQGPRVMLDGASVVNLASNDYLSLAGDPRLVAAAKASLDEDGAGAGASRLIVGNHRRHVELEHAIADWMRCDGVRLFNAGYAANVGVVTSLVGAGDVVFSDELNHASIIDGCRLSRAEVAIYPHRDLAALDAALRVRHGSRRLVVTESLFSMDGDIADLAGIAELCQQHDAALIVDEAHALGTWGPEGRGIAARMGVVPDVVIGTCGKALGGSGAFAATTSAIAELLWNRARPLVFSTALPPSVPAMVTAAIAIVRSGEGDVRRGALAARAQAFRRAIPEAGGAPDSPIAPLFVGDDRRVMAMTEALLEQRVFVQGIRPPTVPEGTARLRVSLSSSIPGQDLEFACESLNNAMRRST